MAPDTGPSHIGELDGPMPSFSSASSSSVETSALLGTNNSQEYQPYNDGSATPHTSPKRVLSYSTLQKRSVLRAESISSAETDLPSSQPSVPTKRRTKRGSNNSPNPKKRCVTRAMVYGEQNVDYDMKHHPMDDLLHPKAAAKRLAKPKSRSPSPLPKKRRITRAMVHGNRNVDYDMKHHPMDDLLYPKAAKERSIRAWASSASSASSNTPLKGPFPWGEELPMPDDLGDPFTNPVSEAWEDLEPLDRRVYIIQKGAPSKGKTLPHTWPKVVRLLVKEQYFTNERFNVWGGIPALEERYEAVRLHMMTLFDAPEEPMEEGDFVLRYSEGFDVYDLQPRVSKSDSAGPNSVNGSKPDHGIHRTETAEEEASIEYEDDYSVDNENLENAEAMTNEADFEGIDDPDMHRYDIYDMIQDYVDDEHGDQAIFQPQTVEIRLSDEVSLHASSIGQDDQSADKQRSSSGIADHTDQKTELDGGLSNQEVSGHKTRRVATKRPKQREGAFHVHEDSMEPVSGGRRASGAKPISNSLDPPKENFYERDELDSEVVAEQLFQDLLTHSGTSSLPANQPPQQPQQAALTDQSSPHEDPMANKSQECSITPHIDGSLPSSDDSLLYNTDTDKREYIRPAASDFF